MEISGPISHGLISSGPICRAYFAGAYLTGPISPPIRRVRLMAVSPSSSSHRCFADVFASSLFRRRLRLIADSLTSSPHRCFADVFASSLFR
ncbi:hypothetical protein OUZ56_024105 [Daphnia magna]|uniref:Uncharacterized protein n=1 Tax=Daphnia magna TaxID=35525 RepID=A0ABR0B069_9CRUS|nr:hypothetical protein OUZ56_024105 [Daphnia magna]